MSNISVTSNISNVNVTSTPSNIIVTDIENNSSVNVTQTNTTITVGESTSNITVSTFNPVSNADVRAKISVANVSGFGNLAYDNSLTSNGVIRYTGVSQADIRGVISNTSPILYNASTGVISANTDAIFSNTLANAWFTTQTTDQLSEGSTNFYYTNERVRDTIANTLVAGANITITSDDANNTTTIAADLIGDITGVTAGAGLTGGGSTGDVTLDAVGGYGITVNANDIELTNSEVQAQANIAIGNNTTDNLSEGSTNLYFTNARSNTAIAAYTGAMTNMTGALTTTGNITGGNLSTGGTLAVGNGASITGNLNVTGNINSETVTDLFVEDRNITLQFGQIGTPSANSQLFVNRGDEPDSYIKWDETGDAWKFSNDGSTEYKIAASTSDLAEGTNLYFTAARSRGNISTTTASPSGNGSLAYDSGTGVFTFAPADVPNNTDELSEGSTNLYFTNARADARVNLQTGTNLDLSSKSTSDLAEGTNLYYTTARANSAITAYTGALTNLTGNITTTANISGGNILGTHRGAIDSTSNITTTANISAGNVLTDHIVSDSGQPLQLKGQTNGIQVDKTISSIESRIFDADTTGYGVATADLGAMAATKDVPGLLIGLSTTAGSNTATAFDLNSPNQLFGIKQTGPVAWTGYMFGGGSLENTITSSMGTSAQTAGWTQYSVTDASSDIVFENTAYITGISGNTVTFSQNAKTSRAGSFILTPGAFSSTQPDLAFTIKSNATLKFDGINPWFNSYQGPETFANTTLDQASYTISGTTVDAGNVVTRNSIDINSNPDSAIRTQRALLIGANATPDLFSVGTNDVLPTSSTLGLTIEQDGLTPFGGIESTPQMKLMLNQYKDNSLSTYTEYPTWTEFLGQTGNATVDMSYIGAPNLNFKILGGDKEDKAPSKDTDVVGRVTWNAIVPNVTGGADAFHPPASITGRMPGSTSANATISNIDLHFQSTYPTSFRNGANTTGGTIPRTFFSSSEGNTVIAAKTDGKIELKPVRDYGNDANASSFTENSYAHKLHDYHTFLSAGFADTSSKSGTILTVQDKSGRTNSNATVDGFNYDSKGNATVRLKTHNTDGTTNSSFDITVLGAQSNQLGIYSQNNTTPQVLITDDSNITLNSTTTIAGTLTAFGDIFATTGSAFRSTVNTGSNTITTTSTISGADVNASNAATVDKLTVNYAYNPGGSGTGVIPGSGDVVVGNKLYMGPGASIDTTQSEVLFANDIDMGTVSDDNIIRIKGNSGIQANVINLFSGDSVRSSNVEFGSAGIYQAPMIRSWDKKFKSISGGSTRYGGDGNVIVSSWADTPFGRGPDMDDAGIIFNNLYFDKHIPRNYTGTSQWTSSNIALVNSTGYTVADADINGTTLASRNVPGLLVSTTTTAGSKDITLAPLFATAMFGIQQSATQYLASFAFGSDAETALGTITNATANGWVFYNVTVGSLSETFETGAYSEGISGNTLTMSETAKASYTGTAILFPGIHLDSAYGTDSAVGTRNDDTGVHFLLQGDTSNTSIPFTNLASLGQRYTMPKNGFSPDGIFVDTPRSYANLTYNSYDSGTVELSNVVQRHIFDIDTMNPGSAVRITDGALLIGKNATPDMYSGGNAVSTQASIEGITVEHDGETSFTANTTPQTRILINQYESNSARSLSAVPTWASLYDTGNTTEDLLNLGAPVFNFKYLGSKKSDRANNNVTADTIAGKIAWNTPSATAGTGSRSGSDLIHPPSSITVRVPSDQTTSGANANISAHDMYFQSTYRTSFRDGSSNANGGIPRTFLASKAGDLVLAAKTDGSISLRPQRDYGNATTSTSYVDNRFAHELHEYHTFLDAKFLGTKTGTLVEIQPKSGSTNGSTSDFNYNSAGDSTLRLSSHHANSAVKAQWDITNDESESTLIVRDHTNSATKLEFSALRTEFSTSAKLKNYTTTEINALSSPEAGDVVFNTTLSLVCVYNGTAWRKINDAAM